MKTSIKGLLRDNLIWIYFLGIGLLFAGQVISSFIDPFPLPNYFNNNFKFTFNIYANFWRIWIAFILFCIIFRKKNINAAIPLIKILGSLSNICPKGTTIEAGVSDRQSHKVETTDRKSVV